ncbi:hypothetical protein HanIR_Chr01g0028731 [Helianthus annuus]|nr:hypothetical protein HanIR_Chr01g0028731 [Helianthus annuus]
MNLNETFLTQINPSIDGRVVIARLSHMVRYNSYNNQNRKKNNDKPFWLSRSSFS